MRETPIETIEFKELERARLKTLTTLTQLQSDLGTTHPEIGRFFEMMLQTVMHGGRQIQCAEFVDRYMKIHKIEVKPTGLFKDGDLVKNHKALFHRLYETWKAYRMARDLKNTFSKDDVALEFEAITETQWDNQRQKLKTLLKPKDDPETFDTLLRDFVRAICGHKCPDEEGIEFRRALAFVGHFLWQTQMKLHCGPTSVLKSGNQAMLMLLSRQQKTGKSTTVRMLLSPFLDNGFVWRTDFGRLEDQFSMQNLAYNYVAWFDDAARSSVKNMSKFKQVVTEDEVHYRGMYSNTEHRMPKLAVLIGTSNKSAKELINDTTGLRRFHQIEVNGDSVDTGRGIDLDFLSSFDFLELWKTCPIGEEASPLFTYLTRSELGQYESSIRPRGVVELWISASTFVAPSPGGATRLVPAQDFYDSFLQWASQNGVERKYIPTSYNFETHLQAVNIYREGNNYKVGVET